MASRTRLYQRARSPLIQGRSKRERPLWQPISGAFGLSLVGPLFIWWLVTMIAGSQPGEALVLIGADLVGLLARCAPGAAIGAVGGVLGARAWGSKRPWLPGAIIGTVLAGLGLLFIA